MSKNELIKRYGLFIFSLFLSAMGVALTKQGEMGFRLFLQSPMF